jgi:EmrB/QacA subfamily drug resistance transporter
MQADTVGRQRRIGVLLTLCIGLFLVGLDITIVNVALPTIGTDMDAGISGLQWTVDSYLVVMASLLMLSGSVADHFGRKRIFLVGLTVFSISSALCAVASSVGVLIGFRVIQAIGASMLNPAAMSIITNTFTDPRERAQAVGVWGAVFGASIALGPIVGGLAVSSLDWRVIFLLNIPVGLAAIVLTARLVPDSRAPRPRRFDPVGQVAVLALLAGLTFGIIEAPHEGWTSPPISGAFGIAALALVTLLIHEPRRREPLVDLRFFRSRPFSASIAVSVAAFAAFAGFLFLNTLYLQGTRGLSPLEAGLATAPMAVMTMLASLISGRIVGRHGPRLPLGIAGAGMLIGSAMLVGLTAETSLPWLLLAYATFGLGFGFVNAPITNAAVSGMPKEQAGVASAIATTSRMFGQSLGVAVVGALVASAAGAPDGASAAAGDSARWLLVGLAAVVLILGVLATTCRAKLSAHRVAVILNPEAATAGRPC